MFDLSIQECKSCKQTGGNSKDDKVIRAEGIETQGRLQELISVCEAWLSDD